jgi:dienelactone hydrolase
MSPRRTRPVLAALGAAALVAALAATPPALRLLRGAAFVVRAAGLRGEWTDRLAAWRRTPFSTTAITVPTRHGPLRGRLYRPAGAPRRSVLLTAGVHAEGIDEPRLVKLAGDLAATGIGVVTPELPDLLEYRITPRLVDLIADAAAWAAGQPAIAPDGRVGLIGISFAGGLSIVAAGRPEAAPHVAFTVSFGGHGDLGRVLRYLCTGVQPDGTRRPPHDYGVVIVLLNAADRLLPPADVEPLREGIRTFLRASHIDMVDHARARLVFDEAIALEAGLAPPAARLLHLVNTRDVQALGPILLPHVEGFAADPALSPERSPAPPSPVFLLHGTHDNVIPAIESELLGRALAARGTPVRLLVTPLITHAEVDRRTTARDVWDLLEFWGDVLAR